MGRCKCDYCMGRNIRREFRQDHGSDGFEQAPHKKAAKPKKRKRLPGCAGNDGNAHIYVWTTEYEETGMVWRERWDREIQGYRRVKEESYHQQHGFHMEERKVCIGCGKRAGRRYTEKFQKHRGRVGWWKARYG